MEERRKLERFSLSAPARVLIESEDSRKREELNLMTKDVSSDGAFLCSSQPLPEGANVSLELLLSLETLRKFAGEGGKARIRLKGKVIRVDGNGAAIRFASKYKITALEDGHHRLV
jgi:hypothetical protein